jgi:hypothetical protein
MFSQNAGNAISETQILKLFRGSMPPDLPRNLAPSALGWWFRHWLAPPKKTLLDPPLPVAGTALKVGGSPQSSGNRQIIESQSANCFRSLENINWIGRKKVKYFSGTDEKLINIA